MRSPEAGETWFDRASGLRFVVESVSRSEEEYHLTVRSLSLFGRESHEVITCAVPVRCFEAYCRIVGVFLPCVNCGNNVFEVQSEKPEKIVLVDAFGSEVSEEDTQRVLQLKCNNCGALFTRTDFCDKSILVPRTLVSRIEDSPRIPLGPSARRKPSLTEVFGFASGKRCVSCGDREMVLRLEGEDMILECPGCLSRETLPSDV